MTYLAPAEPLVGDEACKKLKEAILGCIASNHIDLVLDLEQVLMVSGSALEMIIDANAKLTHTGGSLKYVNPSALVKDILIVTGLGDQAALNSGGFW